MYPSDYGYASSGSTVTCNNNAMFTWLDEYPSNYIECAKNSWLYVEKKWQWTLTSRSNQSGVVLGVGSFGGVGGSYVIYDNVARPVLYLKSDTKIVGGLGTFDQPFELGV